MQTFLPYANFTATAKCLDYKRLGKQRVEAYQIHKIVSGERVTGGWINHPAVLMWHGYEDALALYQNIMIDKWVSRGYNNNMLYLPIADDYEIPWWIGNDDLHNSHKSNLLRKDIEYYSQYDWDIDSTLPYYWPVERWELDYA